MSWFAGTLLRASLEGGLFAGVVWLLLQLVPRVPAALRCWLWWAVSLKFLLGLLGLPVLELPVLPSAAVTAATAVTELGPVAAPFAGRGVPADPASPVATSWAPWVVFVLWLLGLSVAAVLLLRDARRLRRVLASAERVADPSLTGLFAELCGRFRLRSATLLLSSQVASPQVVGLTQPRVLVPEASLTRLSTPELAMVLAHELAHVVRGDLLLGWVPTLARRLFFFHPLAALATREYALAREAACDAAAIRVLGAAPKSYGQLLLYWGVVPCENGLAAAAAAPSYRLLKRRLSMLDQIAPLSARRRAAWWLAAGVVALGGLVPLKLVAQSGRETTATAWTSLSAESNALLTGSTNYAQGIQRLWNRSAPFLFVVDGKSYVTQDDALIHQIGQVREPLLRIADRMAELGTAEVERAALGQQMEKASQRSALEMRALLERALAEGSAQLGGC